MFIWKRGGPSVWVKGEFALTHAKGCLTVTHLTRGDLPPDTFGSGGQDLIGRVWTADGKRITELVGHTGYVNSITQDASGRFVTGSWDGTARVWGKGSSDVLEVRFFLSLLSSVYCSDGFIISSRATNMPSQCWVWTQERSSQAQ